MTVSHRTSRALAFLLPLGIACATIPVMAQDTVGASNPNGDKPTQEVPLADFLCPPASSAEGSNGAIEQAQPSAPPSQVTQDAGWSCSPLVPVLPIRPAAPDLFQMAALPIESATSMDKWQLARIDTLADHDGPWTELLQQANVVTVGHPLRMVNSWVNWHLRYQEDRTDDWSDPLTTLERGFGDCEDFAIAKMALLEELGVSSDDMFLVLLKDSKGASHAVLAVRLDGTFYILDNRTDSLRLAKDVREYTPIVSYSGNFEWVYGRPALQFSDSR